VSIELITIYFHSFKIFNIQIGEMTFCKPDFIIIKSNHSISEVKQRLVWSLFGWVAAGEIALCRITSTLHSFITQFQYYPRIRPRCRTLLFPIIITMPRVKTRLKYCSLPSSYHTSRVNPDQSGLSISTVTFQK
jgi:hypothetical protein